MPCVKRKPHDWLFPMDDDPGLECARCGKLMEKHRIHGYMKTSVVRSAINRLGPKHGPRFVKALEAMLSIPRIDIVKLRVTRKAS